MPHPTTPGADPRLAPLYRKITWRLLPFLLLCYVFAYLDRINIGFAKLQMQQDIGISDAVYGLGAGIFFLGYVIFEVPSNLLLTRIGARRTISRIMVLWGLTSASMLFVQGEWSFYILRFMLGVFEAGFAPGMIFYLTYWYSQSRMAGVMAVVMLAGPIGGIVGGPVSAWIMTAFSGAHGLDGWQWMFLLEGLPCVLLGVIAYRYLDDKPAEAKWLSADEKALLAADLETRGAQQKHAFKQVLRDPAIYRMALTYFCLICGIYAVSFWLPTLLKLAGVQDTMEIGLYSAVPYIAAAAFMLWFARSSDRMQERRWHTLVPALLAGVSLCIATAAPTQFALSLTAITLATGFMWASYTVFWAIPSQYLKGEAAAGGIALINSIGLLGGFLSPSIIGWSKEATGTLAGGLYVISALLVAGALLLLVNRPPRSAPARA
ncbi:MULTISPECIES: MFS transporter [Achromobacter]|uniref:MFS transporter n=1 Tax=Alcaligenes xylosoxydans xylosoxydans TaxID=85698 RepID=A0A424WC50_ALCXX|nr:MULTISPECIES: MFS transporter [Achromobacter]MBC9906741.1 MFS transporter [Achromobacter xylosoxidans]MBD0870295.1 MFS transporter [Achromobacter xylosoxidans]MDH1299648.1 MFS transporter [Achromobacter sp. GD03932]QNP83640.1 MFS transporter [Achromobacter xylosoxidans]RPJ90731.1 MFS transporter [Achromobacter xylosoxidans]